VAGDAPAAATAAAQLSRDRAARVARSDHFDHDAAAIARICRAVDGLPLAIELAAAFTRPLECGAIADEIEARIDFLAATMRDVPSRHRSMQAVFQQSWDLLDDEEREVCMRLSVFVGDFGRGAAVEVAGASLPVLTSLVDQSLVYHQRN